MSHPSITDAPTLRAASHATPPEWALLQRHLIDTMSEAALWFVDRYTRPDGTLVWRDAWPGMDGSDDGYESFHNFPLLYALGGDARLLDVARREWDAITWQFTEYGQVYREFDAYYDWMHHGESSIYLYYLGLADPRPLKDRQRAVRFAAMYAGEDPEAPNYDSERKLIRSPITGSRGPRFEMTAEDWCTHREVLAHYPPPFEDIPGAPGPTADWTDDRIFAEILRRMNARMAKGDVPLNLTATSLITHAFLHTGDEKYRRWVLDYLDAWVERTRANQGILPDNVGLSGRIGECMDGKWWGGYYGWRWPHGIWVMLDAAAIACHNAVLLTGDLSHLDLLRSQLDLLWSLGKEIDGAWRLPNKHLDAGWADYRPANPRHAILAWNVSLAAEDQGRLARFPHPHEWDRIADTIGKGDQAHTLPWYRYAAGRLPEYPVRILRHTARHVARRIEAIRRDKGDPQSWDVHHWQDLNPVVCEGLVQTMLGAPQAIYHGGLLHSPVRYFDPEAGRAGLPRAVGALVEAVDAGSVTLHLVNLDPLQSKTVIVQGGAFGEHEWQRATDLDTSAATDAGGPWLPVELGPAAGVRLRLEMRRYARTPAYGAPWDRSTPKENVLRSRLRDP